jgi:hypothetical protein
VSLADLAWAVEDVRRRIPGYRLAVDYDEGRHRLMFATDKYRNTFGDLFREFADNMMDDVLDSITDRLQIAGWTATQGGLGEKATDLWTANRGDARAGGVHRNGFREGDGFFMVQEDQQGNVRFWKQKPHQMAVRYSEDSPDQIDVAAKVWRQGKRYLATLFYPDGVTERYATKGSSADGALPKVAAFRPLEGRELAALDLESHVSADGEGMPVFHYPNGEVSDYGRSLVTKCIPLQDALNKSVTDMLVAMEFHAYPQRWATGVEVQRDPLTQAEVSPFKAGEGRVWRTANKEARMGQFEVAEMTGFLEVQDGFRLAIARKGRMPGSEVATRSNSGAGALSGLGLLVMEGRAIKLARDRQRDWGYQHREMMAYGLRLQGYRDATADNLNLEWAPPETRDEAAFWEMAAQKRALGVPLERILLEAGYPAEDVKKFLLEKGAEAEADQLARDFLTGGRQQGTNGQAATLGVPTPPVQPAGAAAPAA